VVCPGARAGSRRAWMSTRKCTICVERCVRLSREYSTTVMYVRVKRAQWGQMAILPAVYHLVGQRLALFS